MNTYVSGYTSSRILYRRGETPLSIGLHHVSGEFAKLQKVTLSSVRSVRMIHLGFRRTYFHEISYTSIFRKPVEIDVCVTVHHISTTM